MINEAEQKENTWKQWIALNPGATKESFEVAYPALKTLAGENGQSAIPIRNRNERSMADQIAERQGNRK